MIDFGKIKIVFVLKKDCPTLYHVLLLQQEITVVTHTHVRMGPLV